jgi:VanZ family protein
MCHWATSSARQSRSWGTRVLAGALAFPVALNAGKLFVAGRHASFVDLVVNLAGLLAGFFAYRWCYASSISGVKSLSGETPPRP